MEAPDPRLVPEGPELTYSLALMDGLAPPRWLEVPVGTSVRGALALAGVKRGSAVRVFLGTEFLKEHEILPVAGDVVVARVVPEEAGTIIIIVLLIIVVASTVTNLVLLLTAKQPERDADSRFDSPILRGTRNRAAPHEPIPRVYGKYRFKPPLGAYSYTEVIGGDHYLRALFVIGYGPLVLDVADMRIGETPLSSFIGYEIEIRPGELTDLPITLYPAQVTQQDANIQLYDNQTFAPTGPKSLTSDANTDEVGIELFFPEGLGFINDKGNHRVRSQDFKVEYRPSGGGAWTLVPRAILRVSSMARLTGATESSGQIRVEMFRIGSFPIGINFPLPSRGTWEVRIEALTGLGGGTVFGEVQWRSLKSFRNEAPFDLPGVALVALRIKASDQLQGTIEDFSVLARAKLSTFDGASWTAPVETRNAAWAYADVLRGSANPDPIDDALIDGQRIKEWAELIEAHTTPDAAGDPVLNPMYFDGVIDYRTTVYRALSDIAAVARGTPLMRDGLFSVVFDHDRSLEAPAQLITPRNIIIGSFLGRRAFIEEAHGYRVQLKNEAKDYGDDEVVFFSPGYSAGTARVYEKIDWFGITNADRAVDETRFLIFSRRYRPEIFRIEMDIEHIAFERGDLVLFAHDVPLLGLAYGRVSIVTHNPDPFPGTIPKITLDEECTFEPGKSYAARIRRHHSVLEVMDSLALVNLATTDIVKSREITFVTPIPYADRPVVDDLVSFGEAGIETRRCVVRSISPQNDLTAVVELEDEGGAIFGDLTDPIPDYDPGINRPVDLAPLPPRILSVRGDFVNLLVTLQMESGHNRPVSRYEVQVRTADDPTSQWQDVPGVPLGGLVTVVVAGLELDQRYDVRARSVGPSGLASEWIEELGVFHYSHAVEIERYFISGLRLENVAGFDLDEFVGPDVVITWQLSVLQGLDAGDPLSDARSGAETTALEFDRFEGYRVRILEADLDPVTGGYSVGVLIDESLTQDTRFTYAYHHNVEDGGPRRALFFEVAAQLGGLITAWARKLTVNHPPAVPELISISALSGLRIELLIAAGGTDPDWEGFLVWRSETQGFVPSLTTLVFKGRLDRFLSIPSEPGHTYYVRYASFDAFSADPDVLNLSDEETVVASSVPGTVEQFVEVLAKHFTAPSLYVRDYFTYDLPPGVAGGNGGAAKIHQVSFLPSRDGFLVAQWHAAHFCQRFANNIPAPLIDRVIFCYSAGEDPVVAADQLIISENWYGSFIPLAWWGHYAPPGAGEPMLYTEIQSTIQVTTNQRIWVYAWVTLGNNGWGGITHEWYIVDDALWLQQVT